MLDREAAVFMVAKRPSERRSRERSFFVRRIVNKQDEGHFRKSRNDLNLCDSKIFTRFVSYVFLYMYS